MEGCSNIIPRNANIICSAENFHCAGIVNFTILALMTEAFGKFRSAPPRITDDARAGRHEPQTAAEELSHNIAKRWRMGEARLHMGKGKRAYFEYST